MSPKRWKPRLEDMIRAATAILDYTAHIHSLEDFQRDQKTFDACVRNFQILGEASKHVPLSVRKVHSDVPWDKIKGMRNILVHDYFGASPGIIWKTIQDDLPQLRTRLKFVSTEFEKVSHPWKVCPVGEYFVHASEVDSHERDGVTVKAHVRRAHCREYSHEFANVLSESEARHIAETQFSKEFGSQTLHDLGFGAKGKKYDVLILGWVKFWNEVFRPDELLDPNLFKALVASESGFDPEVGAGSRNKAKGLCQLMPLTIKALEGYRNEIRDHQLITDGANIHDPNFNISAGVRWLFQKKVTASRRLNREATWVEAVEEYKDVLRRRLKNPKKKQKAWLQFSELIEALGSKK